jgi:hypothetical protein
MENHTRIRRMEPRLLVLNFDNHAPRARLEALVSNIVAGVAESSRWHGYKDAAAPAFLGRPPSLPISRDTLSTTPAEARKHRLQ